MHKKIWQKPQLIILSRGRSEEKVLEHCKGNGDGGPVYGFDGCSQPSQGGGECGQNCFELSAS